MHFELSRVDCPGRPDGQAVVCTFPLSSQHVPCSCVLMSPGDRIEVTTPDGHLYQATLPCRAARVFTLGSGLLVERTPFAEELSTIDSPTSVFFRRDGRLPKDVAGASWWSACEGSTFGHTRLLLHRPLSCAPARCASA